jgi:hypothetical protein
MPLFGFDHAEMAFSTYVVEMVNLAADGFEAELALIDELVPVKGVDHLHAALLDFDHFLLQLTFNSGDTTRFEIREVLRDDFGGQTRNRIRQVIAAWLGSLKCCVDWVQRVKKYGPDVSKGERKARPGKQAL